MKNTAGMLIALLFAVGAIAVPANAANLASFNGGVGVIPTGSANTTVRTVLPAGQIWVIRRLAAAVKDDGSIEVVGKGLLLGSGNTVGSNANNAHVFATLMCANDGNVQHNTSNTPGVQLAPNGDFVIEEALSPAPPSTCDSPALLIRNAGNGGWFAAALPAD
jgi:hypothetical protein